MLSKHERNFCDFTIDRVIASMDSNKKIIDCVLSPRNISVNNIFEKLIALRHISRGVLPVTILYFNEYTHLIIIRQLLLDKLISLRVRFVNIIFFFLNIFTVSKKYFSPKIIHALCSVRVWKKRFKCKSVNAGFSLIFCQHCFYNS